MTWSSTEALADVEQRVDVDLLRIHRERLSKPTGWCIRQLPGVDQFAASQLPDTGNWRLQGAPGAEGPMELTALLDAFDSAPPSVDTGGSGAGKGLEVRTVQPEIEAIEACRKRRKRLLEQDARGRTSLFHAAERGLEEEVWEILSAFSGTGLSPTRLSLITTKDHSGLTAADVAEEMGHEEIARSLRAEQARMEYYE